MLSLYQALRLSFKLYRLDLSHVESYQGFTERFHHLNTKNSHWTERQVREAYDLWRRDIVKAEVRAEFEKNYIRLLLIDYLKNKPRQITIATMVLLALAVVFPPYYISAGDQSISMGLAFAFDRQIGRIDSMYLLCELGGVLALSWFAQRLVRVEGPAQVAP